MASTVSKPFLASNGSATNDAPLTLSCCKLFSIPLYVICVKEETPNLGEVVAFDVKHIYAWVKENNPRAYIKDRYDKTQIPLGDPDCRLGVKRSTNTAACRSMALPQYGTLSMQALFPNEPVAPRSACAVCAGARLNGRSAHWPEW
jgi:hypothetical protein